MDSHRPPHVASGRQIHLPSYHNQLVPHSTGPTINETLNYQSTSRPRRAIHGSRLVDTLPPEGGGIHRKCCKLVKSMIIFNKYLLQPTRASSPTFRSKSCEIQQVSSDIPVLEVRAAKLRSYCCF